jgi:TonB family protein
VKPLTQEHPSNSVTSQVRRLRVDAILISSDDSFLIELGPLLGDNYRTHTVDSPLALGNFAHRGGWLAIVDVAALADARAVVSRMSQRYPKAPIIVVTPNAADWTALVSRGAIVDAIARSELSGTRFTEALSKAAASVREEVRVDTSLSGTYRGGHPFESGRDRTRSPPVRALLPWAAAAMVVLAGGLGWWYHWSRSHRPVAPRADDATSASAAATAASGETSTLPPTPATGSQTILELLSAARVQFHDQKLLFPRPDGEPRGDSALELYAQVLSQDPSNAEALDGIGRLWAIAKERIEADTASGKLEDAARLIALFKAAGLNSELLQPLSAGINAARPRMLLARAQQSIDAGDLASAEQLIAQLVSSGADADTLLGLRRALDAKRLEQQLAALSTRLQSSIAAGALLTPEGDSAMAHLTAMRSLSRNHAVTLAAQRELRAALLTRATQATQQKQFDLATRLLAAASELGGSSELADAKRQLQDEMDRAARAEQAAAAPSPPPTSATPETLAAAPSSAAPSFIAATPLRPLDVSYPAQARGIEGHVIVEFTLHANGTATDAVVIEAKPHGLFDHVALVAVRGGHYDSSALAGSSSRRARINLHFKPE